MYKILIKYTSTFNKVYYRYHTIQQEDGTTVEYSSFNSDELKAELKKLDMIHGFENLRVVLDITSELDIIVAGEPQIDITTSEEIDDIYATAYNKIFGGDI